jgi:hypothetical protein
MAPDAPPLFDDAELLAWREGRLSADAAASLEDRLAQSAEGRAVALALADPPNDFQLLRAEKAALSAVGARAPRARWGLALAAAMLAGIGGWWVVSRPSAVQPAYLAGPLEGGAALVRGAELPKGTQVFYASSTLRLTVRPQVAQVAPPVQVVLAGADGRLLLASGWTQQALGKGTVEVVAPAAALFDGRSFGPWTVHVVLGAASGLAGLTAAEARVAYPATWWSSHPVQFVPEPEGGR